MDVVMSSRGNDEDCFVLVYLGSESDANKPKLPFTNEFIDLHELKKYLNDQEESSIILILSNQISFESFCLNEYPQICAVFNSNLVCLYCLSSKSSLVTAYLNQSENQWKKSSKKFLLTYFMWCVNEYWLIIGLGITMLVAYLFPDVGKTGGFIHAEWTVKWGCIMLIFFFSGLSVQPQLLLKEFLNIRLHFFIQIFSLLITPLLMYGTALLLGRSSFNKSLLVGLIILGSTCTTISSNVVMTKSALGNEYAALINAIFGNILSIFFSPLVIYYLTKDSMFKSLSNSIDNEKHFNYLGVVKSLCITVLCPLIVGQILHLLWPKQIQYIRRKFYLNKLNSLALLVLVWSVFCDAFISNTFQIINRRDLIILIFLDCAFYIVFSLLIVSIARIPIKCWQYSKSDTIAMVFCGASKSMSMCISLINAFYQDRTGQSLALISIPFIIYYVVQIFFGAIQVLLLKKWVQKTLKEQISITNPTIYFQLNQKDHQHI